MAPIANASNVKLAPLIALPVELKLKVVSFINEGGGHFDESGHFCPHPSLMTLRRVHRTFRQLIPNDPNFHAVGYWRIDQLRAAERKVLDPLPVGFYPCYGCLAVLHQYDFNIQDTERLKGLGGQKARQRRCLECIQNKSSGRKRKRRRF